MPELVVRLNRVSPVPLYHQLADQLKGAIADGVLPKGSFLGNELALAERWQVSRPTVRRAIQDLVDDGLLVRKRGVGTQIVNDQVRRPVALSSLYDDLAESGRRPSTDVLLLERVGADADLAAALGVAVGEQVVHVERCRYAGRRRLALLRNWIVADLAADLTPESLARHGLYELLRERGVRPHFANQRIGAKAATANEAEVLGLAVGAPLVTMRRVLQDDTGRRVEVGDHVYDAEHYSVEVNVVAG